MPTKLDVEDELLIARMPYRCSCCGAVRKSRASSVLCTVCHKGELRYFDPLPYSPTRRNSGRLPAGVDPEAIADDWSAASAACASAGDALVQHRTPRRVFLRSPTYIMYPLPSPPRVQLRQDALSLRASCGGTGAGAGSSPGPSGYYRDADELDVQVQANRKAARVEKGDNARAPYRLPPPQLLCDLCGALFGTPVRMPNCDHKFCRSCVMSDPLPPHEPAAPAGWEVQVVLNGFHRTERVRFDPDTATTGTLKRKVSGLCPTVSLPSMQLSIQYMGSTRVLSDNRQLLADAKVLNDSTVVMDVLECETADGLRCPVCREVAVPRGGDVIHGIGTHKGLRDMAAEYRTLRRVFGHNVAI